MQTCKWKQYKKYWCSLCRGVHKIIFPYYLRLLRETSNGNCPVNEIVCAHRKDLLQEGGDTICLKRQQIVIEISS